MKTIEDIKARCVIDEITGCWHWKGAIAPDGQARVWAFDFTKGRMAALTGKRAAWYAANRRPIPDGYRVYGTCSCPACVNPAHTDCGTTAEWGEHLSKSGIYKNKAQRRVIARKTGAQRSVLTAQTYHEVITSTRTGRDEARRLGVSEQTVSKARSGALKCFLPVASPFAGLGGSQ